MAKWSKRKLRLDKGHRWKAKPGYKIFVANWGDVRFDFPADWVVIPGDDSIKLHDRQPPDDDCVLQVSVMHLPRGIDWSSLPLAQLLEEVTKDDSRGPMSWGEIQYEKRPDFELAWLEARWVDPSEQRDACSRACLARGSNVQPLITMDFWLDDMERFLPVWDEVLRSLRVGDYVKDPRLGEAHRLDRRHN